MVTLDVSPARSECLDHADARRLAARLATAWTAGDVQTATWLNHSSALVALLRSHRALEQMDYVGIDGILLKKILRCPTRTSADLVVPQLLPMLSGARIALVGGTADSLPGARSALERCFGVTVVLAVDGFDGLLRGSEWCEPLAASQADVVLIGLGAGLQDEIAIEISGVVERGLILTCGGFLDQVQHDRYYPSLAYKLKINWLIRLMREPRRLYRRYTVGAFRALRKSSALRAQIRALPGYQNSCSR